MRPRICVCCGEQIAQRGNTLSRNPNVCASCSSLADGMEESSLPDRAESAAFEGSQQPVAGTPEEVVLEAHAAALPS
jgi:hypothetical protein